MKDLLMTIQELVYDAIEAGAKTDQCIYAYVNQYVKVDLDTIKSITTEFDNEWM
jgi:hypothetical protein